MKAGNDIYFFDTYALIEISKGNINYSEYINSRVITTILNLMEFYSILLKESNKDIAEQKFNTYLKNCVEIDPEVVKKSVRFRLEFIAATGFKISYVDAIGYVIAKKLNIPFLTGDMAFKDLPNVEFVK